MSSARPATSCLIWPPPECHFEFTSQVRIEEERGKGEREREELEFSERFWSAAQRKGRNEGRPGGAAAVARFVRLLMRVLLRLVEW